MAAGWPKLISFPVKAIIAHKNVLMQTITQEEETESGPKLAPKCQVVNLELSQNTDSAMTRTSHWSNQAINIATKKHNAKDRMTNNHTKEMKKSIHDRFDQS